MTERTPESRHLPDLRLQVFDKPDSHITTVAQEIGIEAWSEALGNQRLKSDVSRHFGIPEKIMGTPKRTVPYHRELMLEMEIAAEIGRFRGVVASAGNVAVGYGWAVEDARPTQLQRTADWWQGRLPAVSIKAINVLPEMQSKGVGGYMLSQLLDPFAKRHIRHMPPQRVEGIVPTELEGAILWLENRGFNLAEDPMEPDYRFGIHERPVELARVVAPSVAEVRRLTETRYTNKPGYLLLDAKGNEMLAA